jgi:predicted AlkP superfamily pyrophosphatase or phosphodiesterase
MVILLSLVFAFAFPVRSGAQAESNRIVVVVLVDGFAASLLERAETPTLDRLRREGRYSDALLPAFPSVSHTNWVSLSTGCWPEHHGIVSNHFEIDGERADFETVMDADSLLGCQYIHEVAEAQGVRTAVLGWPGSRSTARGQLASVVEPMGGDWSAAWDSVRAAQVIEQLERTGPDAPRLILAYFNGPDTPEHVKGIKSKQTRIAIEQVDAALATIVDRLSLMSAEREVTLFVLTDHGMKMINRMLNVKKLMRRANIAGHFIADGALAFVYLDDPKDKAEAVQRLTGDDRYDVVLPASQPEHWRIGTSKRVGDFMLYTRPPYFFPMDFNLPSWAPAYGRWWPVDIRIPRFIRKIGMHGYAHQDEEAMKGMFLAWGSGIAKHNASPLIESPVRPIDLHPTLSKLLGIRPGTPIDGQVLNHLLE